jgi:hypothetical protein
MSPPPAVYWILLPAAAWVLIAAVALAVARCAGWELNAP